MRKVFFKAWKKHRAQEKLAPMETLLVQIISLHPEYHYLFDNEKNLAQDFSAATDTPNPFLHLSLHLAVQEQLSLKNPAQLPDLYQQLIKKYSDPHKAEHEIMECLSEMIWQLQHNPGKVDESQYMECLRKKISGTV